MEWILPILVYICIIWYSFNFNLPLLGVILLIIPVIVFRKKIIEIVKNYNTDLNWNKALENNRIKKEAVEYINDNYLDSISIFRSCIEYSDGKIIKYSDENYPNMDIDGCRALANQIRNNLKYKKLYSIKPITEYKGGSSSSHLIGFTQTYNGNFVADYSGSDPTEVTIGYKLKLDIETVKTNKQNTVKDTINAWNN